MLSLFHHLANHQMIAIHNGVTASSAFLIPRANALTSEHAISRSRSSQARLLARNSKSSTSPVRIGDCRDLFSVLTGMTDPFLIPGTSALPRRWGLTIAKVPGLFFKAGSLSFTYS